MDSPQVRIWDQPRIRLVRQTEMAECGVAALAMVASFHGLDISLAALRRRFSPSLRGTSLQSLMAMADELALIPRAVSLGLNDLSDLALPAILHWNFNHFVVIERVRRNQALIHDPAGQSRWYRFDELSKHFTGVALELRPANDFEPAEQREHLKLAQLWERLTGLKRALAQTLVLSLVMQAFVLASPYYMQVAIDQALPALDLDLLTVLALGFGLFTLINAVAALLRSFVLLSAGTSLSFGIAVNIARRLFRLPISWFEKRHVGDILSRFQSIAPIQQALTQGAVAALIDGMLAIFVLGVMFLYSALLALLAMAAFALYLGVRLVSFSLQRHAQQAAIICRAREQSMLIESIRGIVTLRLFNREGARHAQWQTRLTEATNADISLARISVWQQVTNSLIFGLETVVSTWLAVRFAIDGGFSVGMVFAYVAYKTQFLTRGASLVDQAVAFRMLGLHLERLSDVAMTEPDIGFRTVTVRQPELKGRIELRNVSFAYGPGEPPVLENVNLLVRPGDHIAITGPSGGGKTTLAKILLGLLEPDEGEVLVDNVPLQRFGHKNYHEQIAAVLQDDHLFAGSLADNIALFADDASLDDIVTAARMAAIDEEIADMPMGYETLVGDMGSSLSGGQRQRVLLARALYRQPRFLLMDEGTSQLDFELEKRINAAIAGLGMPRLMIAHRAETIAAADRLMVMRGGKLAQA